MQKNIHITVLLQKTIELLGVNKGDVVVDGTMGAAGHSLEILRNTKGQVTILGIDMDQVALDRSRKHLQESGFEKQVIFSKGNFSDIKTIMQDHGFDKVDRIVLDLGFSSNQLELEGRGFSFLRDEPLLMTLSDDVTETTAYDVVNHWNEESISDILHGFGDERFSRRIAKAIIQAREIYPIKTTRQLVQIIEDSVPKFYRHGKIHPATRTFQAIRIAVNKELESLQTILETVPRILSSQGRIAIISFHSLEDRVVKRAFLKMEQEGFGQRITKKPVVPDNDEIQVNPRSRSAKLRVFEIK